MLQYNATNNYGVKYWKFSVFVANGDAVDRKLIEDDIILQDYIILQDDIIVKEHISQKLNVKYKHGNPTKSWVMQWSGSGPREAHSTHEVVLHWVRK